MPTPDTQSAIDSIDLSDLVDFQTLLKTVSDLGASNDDTEATGCFPKTVTIGHQDLEGLSGKCVTLIADQQLAINDVVFKVTTEGDVAHEGAKVILVDPANGRMLVRPVCESDPCDLNQATGPIAGIFLNINGQTYQFEPIGNIGFYTDLASTAGGVTVNILDGNGTLNIISNGQVIGTLHVMQAQGTIDAAQNVFKVSADTLGELSGALSSPKEPELALEPPVAASDIGYADPVPQSSTGTMGVSDYGSDGGCGAISKPHQPSNILALAILLILLSKKGTAVLQASVDAATATVLDIVSVVQGLVSGRSDKK